MNVLSIFDEMSVHINESATGLSLPLHGDHGTDRLPTEMKLLRSTYTFHRQLKTFSVPVCIWTPETDR